MPRRECCRLVTWRGMMLARIKDLLGGVSDRCRALRLRTRLFIGYSVLLSSTVLFSSGVLYILLSQSIESQIENELKNSTRTILNMVRAMARTSIKVHLESILAQNVRYVKYCHAEYRKGALTEDEAKAMAGERLLQQRIGKTGYIFVWDIREGPDKIPLAVHPAIKGQDLAYVDFAQKAVSLKNGYMEYEWANPGETRRRKKSMMLYYFRPWEWVIAASSYKEEFLDLVSVEDFRRALSPMHFGKSGYSFIFDTDGNMVIHPLLRGNFLNVRDENGRYVIREMLRKKEGKIIYTWKNPGETMSRKKLCVYHYLPENNWIVASSSYYEEYQKPLVYLRNIMAVSGLVTLVLVLSLTFWISEKITGPLKGLMLRLSQWSGNDFSTRMDVESGDEIGELAMYFNDFLDRLEKYHGDLHGEIAERERIDGQLRSSLDEKDILLRELYHRTKNNMQVICSLLSLEGLLEGRESLRPILAEIELKIRTMAIVHQNLLESNDLNRIELVEYLRQAAGMIIDGGVPHAGRIEIDVTGPSTMISIDTAIPLGLVISEIVTNTAKHAFPRGEDGSIAIHVAAGESGGIAISYRDSGVGLPVESRDDITGSFGIMIMSEIIRRQLKGTIQIGEGPGFSCVFTFESGLTRERV